MDLPIDTAGLERMAINTATRTAKAQLGKLAHGLVNGEPAKAQAQDLPQKAVSEVQRNGKVVAHDDSEPRKIKSALKTRNREERDDMTAISRSQRLDREYEGRRLRVEDQSRRYKNSGRPMHVDYPPVYDNRHALPPQGYVPAGAPMYDPRYPDPRYYGAPYMEVRAPEPPVPYHPPRRPSFPDERSIISDDRTYYSAPRSARPVRAQSVYDDEDPDILVEHEEDYYEMRPRRRHFTRAYDARPSRRYDNHEEVEIRQPVYDSDRKSQIGEHALQEMANEKPLSVVSRASIRRDKEVEKAHSEALHAHIEKEDGRMSSLGLHKAPSLAPADSISVVSIKDRDSSSKVSKRAVKVEEQVDEVKAKSVVKDGSVIVTKETKLVAEKEILKEKEPKLEKGKKIVEIKPKKDEKKKEPRSKNMVMTRKREKKSEKVEKLASDDSDEPVIVLASPGRMRLERPSKSKTRPGRSQSQRLRLRDRSLSPVVLTREPLRKVNQLEALTLSRTKPQILEPRRARSSSSSSSSSVMIKEAKPKRQHHHRRRRKSKARRRSPSRSSSSSDSSRTIQESATIFSKGSSHQTLPTSIVDTDRGRGSRRRSADQTSYHSTDLTSEHGGSVALLHKRQDYHRQESAGLVPPLPPLDRREEVRGGGFKPQRSYERNRADEYYDDRRDTRDFAAPRVRPIPDRRVEKLSEDVGRTIYRVH